MEQCTCAWCFAELLYHDREKNYVFYEVAARTPSAEERLARVAGRELTESEMNCLISNFNSVEKAVRDSYIHSLVVHQDPTHGQNENEGQIGILCCL